jgi:hypothetical protein
MANFALIVRRLDQAAKERSPCGRDIFLKMSVEAGALRVFFICRLGNE